MSVDWRYLLTTALAVAGFICSVAYLLWCLRTPAQAVRPSPLTGHRPWRRWGAAICAVVSVLFYVGLNHTDPGENPRRFVLVWLAVLLLVICLFALAVVDMLYTRRLTREFMNKRRPGL